MVLVLFESPAGYALFKVLDDGKLKQKPEDIAEEFASPQKAQKFVELKEFKKFKNTTEAVASLTAMAEGSLSKELQSFLKKTVVKKALKDQVAVCDKMLGSAIESKLGIKVRLDASCLEVIRGIRHHLDSLLAEITPENMNAMAVGLSHSLSRYKLKFSPDKVDTMIVQAISLLDDLDKEINTYAMKVKEWYGWHFPELAKLVKDNIAYARTVLKVGIRGAETKDVDLEDTIPEELIAPVKEAAIVSMGTIISEEDILNIKHLCTEVIAMHEYREQLYDYLKNRMEAIAPNLTAMVGELVGARLIAHAGNLVNLAKNPGSTVQILGAEKALFRAIKSKHDTPKYGILFHASYIGKANGKNKGKIARMLAAKCALSARVDALGDKNSPTIGVESRMKVEARLAQLEGKPIFDKVAANKEVSVPTGTLRDSKNSALIQKAEEPTAMEDVTIEKKDKKKDKKDKKEKKEKKEKKKEKEEKKAAKEEKKDKKDKKRKREEDGDEEEKSRKKKKSKKE